MATTTKTNSKRMYSWWWDSHISPKNSKWLQENLTDMDAKIKQMIKLLEEDADSFARRAEMYYKKRPELMKLVEEFYRAYRALAERYDNATGVLRQAHQTMSKAFPNQEHFMMADDSPAGSAMEADPGTPDDLRKDASGTLHSSGFRRNGGFTEESDSVNSRKGLRQFNDLFGSGGRARKGLNFQDEENPDLGVENDGSNDIQAQVPYDSELLRKAEQEISTLKAALYKLEADKEAAHLQYQQTLEKLSYMESEVSRAEEESRGLTEQTQKSEDKVQTLKEAITLLKAEHEACVLQCQQYTNKISDLEERISQAQKYSDEINERASKAETEANSLKQDLARVEADKESALILQKQCLEKISDLEGKLLNAEEDVRKSNEWADKAKRELDTLKQALAKLTEEKETAAVQYIQCLEKIASLECKLALAGEENERLNTEIADGAAKIKDSEERCVLLERSNQSMHSELESLSQEMAAKREELTEKQQELGRLWTCLQEERLRFVEAETAFQTLQHLHNQSQDELKSLAAEFQKRTQILEGLEVHNQSLRNEVKQVKVENVGLNELNLSSALTIRDLQAEILHLRETIGKLETDVELQVDQRNALQQEIYSLKDELKDLEKNHQVFLEQVESVGFSPGSFPSQVKNLMDNNMQLKEDCERSRGEHLALLEKLSIMDKLIEKNAVLENSLSDLNVELEGVKSKVKELEESCQSLLGEKSILLDEKSLLVSRLQIAADNLEKIVEKNNSMELSLLEAHSELEGVQVKCQRLEELCLIRTNEKSALATARESLMSDLDITQKRLESLSQSHGELEQKHFSLENEKQSILYEVEGLRISLDSEKHERASLAQWSDSQLAGMQLQISKLQEEVNCKSNEYEAELDNALNAQIEIFVLQESMQDFSEKGFVLLLEHQKLLKTSELSGRLISELKHENLERQIEVKSLFDQIKAMREGIYNALKTLDANQWSDYEAEEDKTLVAIVLNKIHDAQRFLFELQGENHKLVIENSLLVTLIRQLCIEVENLVTAKKIADQELSTKIEQNLLLLGEGQQLSGLNRELRSMLLEGELKEEILKEELKNLWGQLSDLQGVHQNLLDEKCKVLDEQMCLKRSVLALKGEKHDLEENYASALCETECQKTLSVMFKDILTEKFAAVKGLLENLEELLHENDDLKVKVNLMEGIEDEIQVMKVEKENFLKMVEDLRCKNDELENVRADQERQIMKLFEDGDQQKKEAKSAQEKNQKLEAELLKLLREMEESKCSVEGLNNQLQITSHEVDNWESQAEALFGELQTSALLAAIFETKVHDLAQICENLGDKNNCQAMEIDQLKESAITLHAENEEIKCSVEGLNNRLLITSHEMYNWKSQAEALFGELQTSALLAAVFETKVHDLTQICKNLGDKNNCQAVEIDQLKESAITLRAENEEIKCSVEGLNNRLQITSHEMDNWESQAEALFGELQTSALLAAVFEAKVHDLAHICENLGDKNNCQAMEIDQLKESAITLRADNEEIKCSVEGLNNRLQITSHEMDNWESQAEALFGELQTSALLAAVFETKVHNLAQICENLGDKNNCQAMEIDQLKESAVTLRAENDEVKSCLSLYITALSSLKDSIVELEKHTVTNAPLVEVGDKEEKDVLADEEQSSMLPDAPQDFQELQVQIKAIERALVEKEKLLALENSSANSKLEAALRCIEELKFEMLQGVGMSKLDTAYSNAKELGPGMQKHLREISAGGTEVITKDIILDQISECSSHGISRRETLEANDPMLEMWEMANHDGSIDSNLRKTHKETKAPSDKKHERGHLSMESFSEKEFAIDKLEISKNFSGSYREGNEKKILERLDSDAQKLTNLDIIVQDLKMKVEVAEKSKRGKGIEYGSVKEQLEESEEAISKLLNITQKLKKAVEDEFPFLDEKSALASDEVGVAKKRKVAQQARRGSEKIGRLQMEVQKLQFLLAKLDESRSKGKIKTAETRVLLQDYIYGRTSSKPRRKKGHFCSCVRPQTVED